MTEQPSASMLFPGEETTEVNMRILPLTALTLAGLLGLGLIAAKVAVAAGPPEIPDVVGEWTGTSETVVFGSSPHHPDSEAPMDKARLREVAFTMIVEGQEGRRFWGITKSAVTSQPFAAVFSSSHVFGYGANASGFYHFRNHGSNKLELCYTQAGTNPTAAIVAACVMFTRMQP
ncbi:MAG: hypothetical protein ACR2GC_08895 [Methyloceanibacter sp.]|uniref:hypothetical protein n=1 Tax=Methyloceanibacter sp. TaxID=1965321 RepID=UPI003D9B8A4A